MPAKLLVICALMEMKGASFSYLNFLNECALTEVNEEEGRLWAGRDVKLLS